jgi:hypothetical protein
VTALVLAASVHGTRVTPGTIGAIGAILLVIWILLSLRKG